MHIQTTLTECRKHGVGFTRLPGLRLFGTHAH